MVEPVDPEISDYAPYGNLRLEEFARSIELQGKAVSELPEATSSNHRGQTAYEPYPMIYMDDAEGVHLTDVDGNQYIDFHGGVSSIIVGHRPAKQIESVKEQLNRGPYFATSYELEYETAKLVNEMVPTSDRTKFINTGTEAITSAIRLARAYTGKEKILTFEGMYHGHTDYALCNVHPHPADLGSRRNPAKIPEANGIPDSTLETVVSIPWNDTELLAEKLERNGDEIAAIVTEAVMSNSGLIWPDDEYLAELQRLSREHGVLFILDEVVTGFRMSLRGAQGYFDLEPDLAVFGKALANGYPCAAVTGRKEVMEFIGSDSDKATFMGTFSGNPLVVAAAHANLQLLQDVGHEGYDALYEKGTRLTDGLREILTDAGHDVFVPEFAGFFCLHFTDGETDPSEWRDYRDLAPHVDDQRYARFASGMVGEGIFIPPHAGRINLMHDHTEAHIDRALEAANNAAVQI